MTLDDFGGLWTTLEDSGGLWTTLDDSGQLRRTLDDYLMASPENVGWIYFSESILKLLELDWSLIGVDVEFLSSLWMKKHITHRAMHRRQTSAKKWRGLAMLRSSGLSSTIDC